MSATKRFLLASLISSALLLKAALASAVFLSLDPKATYLRTDSDTGTDAVPWSLFSLGVYPGDLIHIERVGFYTPLNPGYPDTVHYLNAVFSSSATLLGPANPNRVPDAIDAGAGVTTPNTWLGGSPTDIPQDFAVDDGNMLSYIDVIVPPSATHIFFSVNDSLFGDNADPNGDFGATITVIPEPSVSLLAISGLLFTSLLRRRGSQPAKLPLGN